MDIMKVKPWGEDQGDYVRINAEDFDPKFHKKFSKKQLEAIENPEDAEVEPEEESPEEG